MKQRIVFGVLLTGLLLSSGGAVYYKQRADEYRARWSDALQTLPSGDPLPQRQKTPRTVVMSATNAPEEMLKELDALLQELEQKDREITALQSATNRPGRNRNIFSAESWQDRMEELKQNDPAAYEEIMARREERKNRIQTSFAERALTLLERTPSNLTPEEQEEREQMLELLNDTWLLTEQMSSTDTPREERSAIRDELSEKARELRPLLEDERDRQLYDLGIASGYSESEAEQFVDYIRETFEATSLPQTGRRGR